MADRFVYRTADPAVVPILRERQEAVNKWHKKSKALARLIDPVKRQRRKGYPVEPVIVSTLSTKCGSMLGVTPISYRTLPPGWRILEGSTWSALTPYKTRPKKGQDRPDTTAIAKRIEEHNGKAPPGVRHDIPGFKSKSFMESPGMEYHTVDGVEYLYVIIGTPSYYEVDPTIWEPVKLSAYHLTIEQEEAA